jgi:hypothetical protein
MGGEETKDNLPSGIKTQLLTQRQRNRRIFILACDFELNTMQWGRYVRTLLRTNKLIAIAQLSRKVMIGRQFAVASKNGWKCAAIAI